MKKDPYEILGVPKSASEGEIQKAYRKLAKELHPDLNPGDSAAEDRFKTVSSAYELLSNAEQRARFDRGEIDVDGVERKQETFYRHYAGQDDGARYASASGFEDIGDISSFFEEALRSRGASGRARNVPLRGADARYELQVDFMDAVRGSIRRITMPDGKSLDLNIPAGIRDGETLRLKGQGAPGFGDGPAGDALVRISVSSHTVFRRIGDDIELDLPISIDEAVLGGSVRTPTIAGQVDLTIQPGASTGDILRLKGKGIARKGRPPGDQRVVLKIEAPKEIDTELSDFMRRWREDHRYDPRNSLKV